MELEGATLGERHKHFNKLVNDAIENKITFEDIKDMEEKTDIDKLFKIDIASHHRNVDYILETLKSEDMLHASRAIKQSSWLIIDPQYADIVNPKYLNDIMFPHMMTKASYKFLVQIRKNLKEEQRVDEFYKYYDKEDFDTALKWLPNCSIQTIETSLKKFCEKKKNDLSSWSKIREDEKRRKKKYYYRCNNYFHKIRIEIFKRLCKRSFSILKVYNEHYRSYCDKGDYINSVKFLLPTNIEKFLDIAEGIWYDGSWNSSYCTLKLGKKYTHLVMNYCPERVLSKFELYGVALHIPIFVKYLGKENIKDFLMKQIKNIDNMCTAIRSGHFQEWFRYKNIEPFIKAMPKEEKFDFVKKYFIDKEVVVTYPDDGEQNINLRSEAVMVSKPPKSEYLYDSVYAWYTHAPFEVAFPDLKKLMMTESCDNKKMYIFLIMLNCARNNMNYIEAVLQYYQGNHMNESYNHKMQFIYIVLSTTSFHRYNEKCWIILDCLFHSIQVYTEIDNCVKNCVEAVILYKVLHDEPVPEIIYEKFNSESTLKSNLSKLNEEEKIKIFKYLHDDLQRKLSHKTVTNEDEFKTVVHLLIKMLNLLFDWRKDLQYFPAVLDKIKQLGHLKKEKLWETSTSYLYDKKPWRKYLFEDSILLSPSEAVCLNALKHDPGLLKRHKKEVDRLLFDDEVSLKNYLIKLRVYWPESLGKECANIYRERLQTCGNKAVVRAVCTLLPRDELIELFIKYALDCSIVHKTEADELRVSIHKNIVQSMHLVRPRIPIDIILLYAKGSYSHYVLPSLCATFDSMSATQSRKHILKLIDGSQGFLQKCGIRLAFTMLYTDILVFFKIWHTTNNVAIRSEIFQCIHKRLSEENCPCEAEQSWQMLENFIKTLSEDNDKLLFSLIGEVNPRTLETYIQGFTNCYKFLNALPEESFRKYIVIKLLKHTACFMDRMDPDFVKDILLENNKKVIQQRDYNNRIETFYAAYLVCGESEKSQLQRYKSVFVPIFNNYYLRWKIRLGKKYTESEYKPNRIFEMKSRTTYLRILLDAFDCEILDYIFKTNVVPVELFKDIQIELNKAYTGIESYVFVTVWKLKTILLECIEKVLATLRSEETNCQEYDISTKNDCYYKYWKALWKLIAPEFGKQCIERLKKDTESYNSSIYEYFADALNEMLDMLNVKLSGMDRLKLDLCEALLFDKQFVQGYLTVIKLISTHIECKNNASKYKLEQIIKTLHDHSSYEVQAHYLNVIIVERFRNVIEIVRSDTSYDIKEVSKIHS